jgi:hypothetical protein
MESEENPTVKKMAELTERLNASTAAMEKAYADTAITSLQFTCWYAARFALGCLAKPYERGQSSWQVGDEDREGVAMVFDSIAEAIRTQDCAEDISPIRFDEF